MCLQLSGSHKRYLYRNEIPRTQRVSIKEADAKSIELLPLECQTELPKRFRIRKSPLDIKRFVAGAQFARQTVVADV